MKLGTKKWMVGIAVLLVLGLLFSAFVYGASDVVKTATKEAKSIERTLSNLTDKLQGKLGKYTTVVINSVVFIIVGLLLAAFLAPKDNKTQQTATYIGLALLGVLIAWQFYVHPEHGGKFLWEIAVIKNFFHLKVFVNALVIVVITYLVIFEWIFKEKPIATGPGKYLLWITIIVIAFMVVNPKVPEGTDFDDMQPPYAYLWERESVAEYRFFFFGDSACEMVNYKKAETEKVSDLKDNLEAAKDDVTKKEIQDSIAAVDKDAKKEKYCYTEQSVKEYIDATKDKDTKYEPEKHPKILHSGDEYSGFGILRGTHLLMLALSFGMFWWTFKMFMRGDEMKKVNGIMAFILAISIARANWGMEAFMRFIQYWSWGLLFMMFYRSWKGQGGGA